MTVVLGWQAGAVVVTPIAVDAHEVAQAFEARSRRFPTWTEALAHFEQQGVSIFNHDAALECAAAESPRAS
jgi:hypothetical protein